MGLEIQTGYLNSHYSSLEFRAVANGHLYFQTLQTFNRSVKPRYINLVKSLQKCTHSFTPPTSGYSEKKGDRDEMQRAIPNTQQPRSTTTTNRQNFWQLQTSKTILCAFTGLYIHFGCIVCCVPILYGYQGFQKQSFLTKKRVISSLIA